MPDKSQRRNGFSRRQFAVRRSTSTSIVDSGRRTGAEPLVMANNNNNVKITKFDQQTIETNVTSTDCDDEKCSSIHFLTTIEHQRRNKVITGSSGVISSNGVTTKMSSKVNRTNFSIEAIVGCPVEKLQPAIITDKREEEEQPCKC